MKNRDLGIGLSTDKINILLLKTDKDPHIGKILEATPFKYREYCKTKKDFNDVLDKIHITHINEGVLIILTTNFRIDKDNEYIAYINKVILSANTRFNNMDKYVIKIDGKVQRYSSDEIVDIIKKKTRLGKISNLLKVDKRKITIDYIITVNKHKETFKLIIDENKLGMTFDEYKQLDKLDKQLVIRDIYQRDLASNVSDTVLYLNDEIDV